MRNATSDSLLNATVNYVNEKILSGTENEMSFVINRVTGSLAELESKQAGTFLQNSQCRRIIFLICNVGCSYQKMISIFVLFPSYAAITKNFICVFFYIDCNGIGLAINRPTDIIQFWFWDVSSAQVFRCGWVTILLSSKITLSGRKVMHSNLSCVLLEQTYKVSKFYQCSVKNKKV